MGLGGVCMTVRENGEPILVYHFSSIREAAELFDFISDLMPGAQFVIEPIRH
jgi:hypothetical protein